MHSTMMDTPDRFGIVSRLFHWVMVLLLAWQFTSALLRVFSEDTPIEGFFWSTHYAVGFTLFLLAILRGLWGLANLSRRPGHTAIRFGRLATLGHLAMYVLMIVIPFLAILRAYGNGRGFAPYGFEVFAATGERIPALIAPASAVHGLLGWVLLALIVGHVAMVAMHEAVWKDRIASRMV